MKKGLLELTEEQASVLLTIINIAVQAKGLEAAEAGLFFKNVITKAFEIKEEKQLEDVVKSDI